MSRGIVVHSAAICINGLVATTGGRGFPNDGVDAAFILSQYRFALKRV